MSGVDPVWFGEMFSLFISYFYFLKKLFISKFLNLENMFCEICYFLFSKNKNKENMFGLLIFRKLKMRIQLNEIKVLGFLTWV